MCVSVCVCVYIYIYIYIEREKARVIVTPVITCNNIYAKAISTILFNARTSIADITFTLER